VSRKQGSIDNEMPLPLPQRKRDVTRLQASDGIQERTYPARENPLEKKLVYHNRTPSNGASEKEKVREKKKKRSSQGSFWKTRQRLKSFSYPSK